MDASRDVALVEQIAREAGTILIEYFRSDRVDARAKGDRDVVTAADLESERHIVQRLRSAFPEDGIVGEEGSGEVSHSGRTWYIDPLDGTLNFSRGIGMWCVSLAAFSEGVPALGVIYDPIRNDVFTAALGHGAFRNGRSMSPAPCSSASDALVHITIDYRDLSMVQGLRDIQIVAPQVLRTRNLGSAALALAYVADGDLDAMIHRQASAWDYGAGALLVQEAGGRVTEDVGGQYTSASSGILAAATGSLYTELLALLQKASASPLE